MSRRREAVFARLAFGQDPLDDPLNHVWDAVVRHEQPTSSNDNADDVAFLQRFHLLDSSALPAPGFFADLEQQLVSRYPASRASSDGVLRIDNSRRVHSRPPATSEHLFAHSPRWVHMRGAMAVLGVLLVAGLFTLYRAVPGPAEPPPIPAAVIAKPSLQSLAQFEFAPPLWNLPDATSWDHMELGLFSVAPGTSFTTDVPYYLSVDGPLSLTVLDGALTVTPAGPALFFPVNHSGATPVEVRGGESVSIGPRETIIYSAMDGATGSNPGAVPARTLYGAVGPVDNEVPAVAPDDVAFITYETAEPIAPLMTEGASVTLERLELAPSDSFVFEPDTDLRYLGFFDVTQTGELRIEEGASEELAPGPGAQGLLDPYQLRYLTPGPHTIFNLGDQTAEIFLLVVEPVPMPGTPIS